MGAYGWISLTTDYGTFDGFVAACHRRETGFLFPWAMNWLLVDQSYRRWSRRGEVLSESRQG